MIQYVYCIKDDVAGFFSNYGAFVNKGAASREFSKGCNALGNDAPDYSLYESASFNTDTGVYDSYAAPVFIMRGECKKDEI